jgi:hypothetical protein
MTAPRLREVGVSAMLVLLAGTMGCGSLGLALGLGGDGQAAFEEPSLAFGPVVTGARPALGTATLVNVGEADVELVAADLESDVSGVFSFSSTLPLPLDLPPDEAFPLVLRFGPLQEIVYEGTLVVELGDGSVVTLPLTGEGCLGDGTGNRCAR